RCTGARKIINGVDESGRAEIKRVIVGDVNDVEARLPQQLGKGGRHPEGEYRARVRVLGADVVRRQRTFEVTKDDVSGTDDAFQARLQVVLESGWVARCRPIAAEDEIADGLDGDGIRCARRNAVVRTSLRATGLE